ncbi:RagB/SusD family nutrient uptake outer membrane protein [Wenyingzhuangia sp. IMCC45574]
MKTKYIKRLLPLLLLALSFQACTDELEQINPNALTLGSFWTNTADLNTGLNSTYASLREENILGIFFEPTRTDIGVPNTFRQNTQGNPVYDQTFDLTTRNVQDKWAACYRGIFRANQVIDAYKRLESTFLTEDAKATGVLIYAQARAIRGYLYYVLHSSFNNGSVPLHASVPVTFDELQKTFSASDDVKAFYREDLQYGMDYLPATYNAWQQDVGGAHLGRITGGACEALIAKSYMNDNDFAGAKPYLQNIINNYGYVLADDLSKCFTGIDEFNNESIFEINYTTDVNPLGVGEQLLSQRISYFLNNGNRIQPSSWLTLKYREDKVDTLDVTNTVERFLYDLGDGKVSDTITTFRQYSLRMSNSISSVDDLDSGMYGVTSAEYGTERDASPHARQTPNFWKKFTSWNTSNGGLGEDESPDFAQKSGINIPVIRLAEIYLLYAEVMLEEGNLGEALKYINRVRKRSHLVLLGKSTEVGAEYAGSETTYVDDIDMDPDNGLEAVNLINLMEHLRFTEKPLELALESERTIDLRRWGVWKQQLETIAQQEYDSYHYRSHLNGDNPHRWRCFIMRTGEEPTHFLLKNTAQPAQHNSNRRAKEPHLRDALLGSTNFNMELHSYFPVPQTEINANLNWDK